MAENEQIPEELIKLAEGVFYQRFIEKVAEQGYTHLNSEEKVEQAVKIAEYFDQELDKQQNKRNKLAKRATTEFVDQLEEE